MRVPPNYRKKEWEKVLSGMAIGALISWCIFLYIFGKWQEEYSMENREQAKKIQELIKEKAIWQADVEKLNRENQKRLTIQEIDIKIENEEKYNLDLLTIHEMAKTVEDDLKTLLAKDIEYAFQSRELIEQTIENRIHTAHEKKYRLEVKHIVFYTTLSITLNIRLEA